MKKKQLKRTHLYLIFPFSAPCPSLPDLTVTLHSAAGALRLTFLQYQSQIDWTCLFTSWLQSQETAQNKAWRWDPRDIHTDDCRVRALCREEPREASKGWPCTHMQSLGSILWAGSSCLKAGKLGFHILLQDCPLMLSILLHSLRCSPTQNKLDEILVDLCCEIKISI